MCLLERNFASWNCYFHFFLLTSFLSLYTDYEGTKVITISKFCLAYFSIHKRLTHHVGLRVIFEDFTTNKYTKTLLGNQSWTANNHVDPDVGN